MDLRIRIVDTTGTPLCLGEVLSSIFWFLVGSSPALAFFAFQVWG